MSESNGERIKVMVRWVQILDNLEPAYKEKGEFVFKSVVSSDNLGGVRKEGRYPATGHISISDQPVFNREILNWVIFEGQVKDHLVVELYGEELDKLSANDMLDTYRREFRGPVQGWLGTYGPGADMTAEEMEHSDDPEMMGNWRICLFIDRA